MSQTGSKNFQGVRQDIACAEEHTVLLPVISNGGVATNVITFAANALINMGITANMLSGQEIWVIGGVFDQARAANLRNAGAVLHVVSNTANTITCEETLTGTGRCIQLKSNLTGGANIAASDRLVVTARGVIPGLIQEKWLLESGVVDITLIPAAQLFLDNAVEAMFGVIDSATLPDPVQDLEEKYAHGSANNPGRHAYVYNRTAYDTSWPVSTIWGKYLYDGFGWVKDHASDFHAAPGNQVPTYNLYPGEKLIYVADASAFVVNSYVEISDTATHDDCEIRMVVYRDTVTDFITLDRPLRRYHSIVDTFVNRIHDDCTERAFASAKGVTHTMYKYNTIPFHTFRNKKKGMFDDITVNDMDFYYTGHVFNELTLSSTTGKELMMDVKSLGLGVKLNPNYWNPNAGPAAYETFVPPSLSRTYMYDSSGAALRPVHFSRSYLIIDGARWHQAAEIELTITRTAEVQYAHTYIERVAGTAADGLVGGNDPININTGRVGLKYNFLMPLHNSTLWSLVKDKATINTASWVFAMPRSTTFTETWTITLTEIPVTEGKLQLPAEPAESQNILGPPKDVYIAIYDKTPYY